MKKIAVAGAVLAGLVVVGGGSVAYAEEPANCADAITALQRADADHRAAVDADDKAAAAKKADDDLERAEERLADAERDLAAARDDLAQKQARLDELDGADNVVPSADDSPGAVDAKAARDEAQDEVDDLTVVRNDRKSERDDAVDLENDADADALQDEADKTDAAALKRALDDARADFNRICIDEDDPTVTTTPVTPAPAPEVTVVVPQGGVQTGGGPA